MAHLRVIAALAALFILAAPATAASIPFTVASSEPVTVTGMPRIALQVGSDTRYADYLSTGSDGKTLTFSYAVKPNDFDADGITLVSPLDLSGGTIADAAGNPINPAFSLPATTSLKVQTYQAAFAQQITSANASAVDFTITKAPNGASYNWTIAGQGGGSVSGSGSNISNNSVSVSAVDISAFPMGNVTLTVSITGPSGKGADVSTTVTPTSTGVLDGMASPDVAFSTHRLRSGYVGPLIRVRRASDSSEQDIGASNLGGGLDTTALASFCSSSSCYVRTWYDQSGNGRHATQATASWQPRIVNGGTIDRFNGLPAPFFNGTGNALVTSPVLPSATSVWSTHLANVAGYGQAGRGRIWGLDVNPSLAVSFITGGDDYFGASGACGSTAAGNPRIVSLAVTAAGECSFWVNGGLVSPSTPGVFFNGGQALVVGNIGALSRTYNGHIHTLILATRTYPTADRQAIEHWLGSVSGISVP